MKNNNNSKVYILISSPDPEKICAAAARISTTYGSATEIYDDTNTAAAGQLVSKVLKCGHKSIIEHINFTLVFENVSAFVEQFMIEFRLASFTIKSRRYVHFGKMGHYVPEFRFDHEVTTSQKVKLLNLYNEHMDFLFAEYNYLIEHGVPKEDARFILPYSFKSNFYCTVNARELAHIIYSAVYGRGSKFSEIKTIGETLLIQAKRVCPNIFENIDLLEDGREDKEYLLKELFKEINIPKSNSNEICELMNFTREPEKVVAIAAIIKHMLCSSEQARALVDSNTDFFKEILRIAYQDKRKRELEQINFTFRINRISLSGLTHLVRHRMQSINVPSFTEFWKSDDHIIPESIALNNRILSRYNTLWKKHSDLFREFQAMGVKAEDLVYMYLSGNVLDVVTTMNARELFHFLRLRTCSRAQWEIRNIAVNMLKMLRKVAPNIFRGVGPSCYMEGACKEGKLTCGKMKEVCRLFEVI